MMQESLFDLQVQPRVMTGAVTRVRAHQRRVSWPGYENNLAELNGAKEHLHAVCKAYDEAVKRHSSRRNALARAKARAMAVVIRLETRLFGPVTDGDQA